MSDTRPGTGDAEGYFLEGAPIADTKAPSGPIAERWTKHQFTNRLVNPANRRKRSVIIVGTGLAGASAAGHGGMAKRTRLACRIRMFTARVGSC